jgi:hypothetical protein
MLRVRFPSQGVEDGALTREHGAFDGGARRGERGGEGGDVVDDARWEVGRPHGGRRVGRARRVSTHGDPSARE